MSSFLKDPSTQSLTSNAIFNLSFIHTIYFYANDPVQLADDYPSIENDASVLTAYRKHLQFHLIVVLRVFFRALLTVYVAFLVVVAIKLVIIDFTHAALKQEDGDMAQSSATSATLSVSDVHDFMTRSLWKDNGLIRLLKLLLAQGTTAFIVATFVSDPGSMKIASHRLMNVKAFLGSLVIVQFITVAAMNL
jgi:hypothetical protein